MANIGTATVKVLPDLTEFSEIIANIPAAGITLVEDVTFEYDADGRIARQITTRSLTKL